MPDRRIAQLMSMIIRSAMLSVWNMERTGAATTFGVPAVPMAAGGFAH